MDVTTYELHSLQMTTSVLPSMLLGFRLRSFFTKFRGCSCVRCCRRIIKLDLLGSDKCYLTIKHKRVTFTEGMILIPWLWRSPRPCWGGRAPPSVPTPTRGPRWSRPCLRRAWRPPRAPRTRTPPPCRTAAPAPGQTSHPPCPAARPAGMKIFLGIKKYTGSSRESVIL